MTGTIEAVGDVATGATWSRAVEPLAGEHVGGGGHGACLNCGTTLTGRYCHACGQSSHVHRTLMSIVHDLLHGVFHFEGKIWRTVPMLVLHPGQLTRRYIAGERAKFVSPLALFLFTVFLMFATYSAIAPTSFTAGVADGLFDTNAQLTDINKRATTQLATEQRERAEAVAAGKPTAKIDQAITRSRANAKALSELQAKFDPDAGRKPVRVHSNVSWLEEGLIQARLNPGLAVYKVQSASYKYSWALILLSTPMVALLFLRRRRFAMYDHATFVTYSISFMSLLMIALGVMLAIDAPQWLFVGLASAAPPVHMFVQLRGAYALSIFSALWRTVVLMLFAVLALSLFATGMIMLEVGH